jgi:sodium transport system ATP-binding protein
MKEIIRVNGLSKTFKLSAKQQKLERTRQRTRIAVDNLSFTAYEGEIFGLLGPNGAGKTTTLRMLATLIRPDAGDATLNGFSVRTQPAQVRASIGFLTSELKLEEFFTPSYLFDFFSTLQGIDPAVARTRKEALFKRFGIDEFAEVKVSDLSTGMKQKASLVISIVHDPGIIIFDEPTNGLDVITAKVVTDYLFELRGQGKSIILSTHIFSLVEKLCDRVGIVIDGRMTACDTLAAVTQGAASLEDRFFDLYVREAGEVA